MWFRRDLRLADNAALYYALKSGQPVLPIFIFDRNILDDLKNKNDRRVSFIHQTLISLQDQLIKMNSSLEIFYATPIEAFQQLLKKFSPIKIMNNMQLTEMR